MLTSLALIFLVGLSAAAICGYLHLPRIIGMLFTGIILGPHVLGLLDDKILSHLLGTSPDRADHHPVKGGTFPEPCGSEERIGVRPS